uniref:E3 ubiquitin-protein ligase RNF181 n=1 Tax=Ciona intestinalis TaxID=7719 RepID=F6WRI2_CIOIN|nr:E3 ubiquitin-protein ligase RNF126-like [Ciona intestinalis]|eukprot:XP_026690128.1 E3 ubiquitin-protein ligase RNF126-like [Ciona intestinalis]
MVSVPDCLERISAVLQLVGRLENSTGSPPASKRTVANLPVIVVNKDHTGDECQCSVCMEEFEVGHNATKLGCSHVFHVHCIKLWLELHSTCPICRKPVDEFPCRPGTTNVPMTSQASGSSTSNEQPRFYSDNFTPFYTYT